MSDRRRLLALAGGLIAVVVILSLGVLGSRGSRDVDGPPLGASFTDRCYWAVTINQLQGYAQIPCSKTLHTPSPPSLQHAKLLCALDTLSGKPRPAPNNDLANC
jgi:hypothetical protein